ncbi:MAG: GGDEF domain-containing protein [Candidatus Aminicenantia bacterium]
MQIKRALVKHEEKLKEEVRFSEKKRDGREKIKVRRIRLDSFSEITRELDLLSRTYIGKPILHKRKYYQRKYIYTTLKKEISRAQRNRERIVVLMLGIDEFEKINDEYGNKYGEFVVKKVFKIIKSTLRPYDVIARYENNEFIILLINTNNKSCVQIINRIQKAVEKPTITLNSISWNASVSAGICFCPWKKKFKGDYKELIQLADEALHEAKQKGRSRILIHPLSR